MRIWTISDLHLRPKEAFAFPVPGQAPDADVCVVAGDVCDSLRASIEWAGRAVRPLMPVVLVLGNHEFYDVSVERGRMEAAALAEDAGVALLDDSSAVVEGIRFVGGTLWTDFRLHAGEDDEAVRRAMYVTRHSLADYGNIYWNEPHEDVVPRLLRPADTAAMHACTVAYLREELARPFDGPTVVVTHHAPHPGSVHKRFGSDPVNGAFASDLSGLIEETRPDLWIHGHVHDAFDYELPSGTRIVCNPRGYAQREKADFDAAKVVEVGLSPRPKAA